MDRICSVCHLYINTAKERPIVPLCDHAFHKKCFGTKLIDLSRECSICDNENRKRYMQTSPFIVRQNRSTSDLHDLEKVEEDLKTSKLANRQLMRDIETSKNEAEKAKVVSQNFQVDIYKLTTRLTNTEKELKDTHTNLKQQIKSAKLRENELLATLKQKENELEDRIKRRDDTIEYLNSTLRARDNDITIAYAKNNENISQLAFKNQRILTDERSSRKLKESLDLMTQERDQLKADNNMLTAQVQELNNRPFWAKSGILSGKK